MLHLVESNRTERLLEVLARDVRAWRSSGAAHPLDPIDLVVPNRHMGAYLRFGLAQSLGVAANVTTRALQPYVSELLQAAGGPVRLVGPDTLRAWLLELLLDPHPLSRDALAPLRAYLGGRRADPAAQALKAVQLSRRLAELFTEYDLSRGELLAAWREGPVLEGPFADTEVWQRALWLELFGPGGMAERHPPAEGAAWTTLHQLAQDPSPLPARSRPVFVFGVSYVARVFQAVLGWLGQQDADLHLYLLNPSAEFWEDVRTPREARAGVWAERGLAALAALERGADPFSLDRPDNRALSLWGRPGRESILLLHELTGWDFEDAFEAPAADPGLLRSVQDALLTRAPEGARAPAPADASLQLVAAPGVRREVEWVADEIWRLMADEPPEGAPPLRFSDIAVLVNAADREAYYPHIESVFGALHELPRSVVDLPMSGQSRILEAARLLLEVPLGPFSRAEVLRLLAHPAVLGRWPDATPTDAAAAADALGIHLGRDRSDLAGTYVQKDLVSWGQGLTRGTLGAYMAAPVGEEVPLVSLGAERYLPAEGLGAAGARLGLLARSLLADAATLRQERRTLSGWAGFFRQQATAFLHVADDADARDYQHLLDALDQLAGLQVTEREVPGEVASALAREHLAGLTMSRGTYLAEGVVVSSFLPMRAIPFRVIFVLGLGEGRFPAASRRDALDLRDAGHVVQAQGRYHHRDWRAPRDVLPSERDRYTFLETLLSARDRLYLSWVGRDETTGDAIAPSAVVQELRDLLRHPEAPDATPEVLRLPLRRHDDPDTLAPDAPGARAARALGDALREEAGRGDVADPPARILAAADAARRDRLARLLEAPALPEGVAATAGEGVSVSRGQLKAFLECPLQGAARARFGLYAEEDDERADVEEEPFALENPALAVTLRESMHRAGLGPSPADAYEALADRLELAGKLPTGVVGEAVRAGHRALLAGWWAAVSQADPAAFPLQRVAFGRSPEGQHIDRRVGALSLELVAPDGRPVPGAVSGVTDLLTADGRTTLVLTTARGATVRKLPVALGYAVRGYLDALLLAAAGLGHPQGHRVLVLSRPEARGCAQRLFEFPPLAPEEARPRLAALLEDLSFLPHDYVLPAEALFHEVAAHAKEARDFDPQAVVAKVRALLEPSADEGRHLVATRRGPVPRPERYRLPEADEVLGILQRRFGLLVEARRVEASS